MKVKGLKSLALRERDLGRGHIQSEHEERERNSVILSDSEESPEDKEEPRYFNGIRTKKTDTVAPVGGLDS